MLARALTVSGTSKYLSLSTQLLMVGALTLSFLGAISVHTKAQTPVVIPTQSDWEDLGVILLPGPSGSWDVRLGGLFVSGRVLDVPVYSLGTAVDKPLNLELVSRIEQGAGTLHIDIPIMLFRDIQFPKGGCQMMDHLTVLHKRHHQAFVHDASQFNFGSFSLEFVTKKTPLIVDY